jgi:hypothetical protein
VEQRPKRYRHLTIAEGRVVVARSYRERKLSSKHSAFSLDPGAAIYINIAEQPARLQLDNRSLVVEWKAGLQAGLLECSRASRS